MQLLSNLSDTRDDVREAFLAALSKATQRSPSTLAPGSRHNHEDTKATELLVGLQLEDAGSRSQLDNTIFLQSLILIIISVDLSAVAYTQRPIWYSSAYGVAEALSLHRPQIQTNLHESNLTQTETLARRAWLVFLVLDRWYSAGTSELPLATEKALTLLPADHELLGDNAFHISREPLSTVFFLPFPYPALTMTRHIA